MAKITFLLLGQTAFSNLGDDCVNIFPHPTKLLPDHLLVEIIIKYHHHHHHHYHHHKISPPSQGFNVKSCYCWDFQTQPNIALTIPNASSSPSSSSPGQVCRSSKRPQCSIQGLPSWQKSCQIIYTKRKELTSTSIESKTFSKKS